MVAISGLLLVLGMTLAAAPVLAADDHAATDPGKNWRTGPVRYLLTPKSTIATAG